MTDRTGSWAHASLADIPERELVAKLMSDMQWRERLVGIHGIPFNAEFALEVPLDGLPHDPKGDIDILLAAPSHPEVSTAVQVKRVKVSGGSFPSGNPNKLGELGMGYRQANLLWEIGFSQVYIFILVVVDSRSINKQLPSYGGLTPDLRAKIENVISTEGLLPSIGLLRYEFVQPMDAAPLSVGTFASGLIRLATEQTQPSDVTNWVRTSMGRMRA